MSNGPKWYLASDTGNCYNPSMTLRFTKTSPFKYLKGDGNIIREPGENEAKVGTILPLITLPPPFFTIPFYGVDAYPGTWSYESISPLITMNVTLLVLVRVMSWVLPFAET